MTKDVNPQVETVGGKLAKELVVIDGIIKYKDDAGIKDVIEIDGALAEGQTPEQYKAFQKQQGFHAMVTEYAVATVGHQHFANGGSEDKLTAKLAVGNQNYNVSIQREKQIDVSAPGATEPQWETRFGVVGGGYETKTTAEHKRLRASLFNSAKSLYGDKK